MVELSTDVHEKVTALCAKGDEHAEAQRHAAALKDYWAAWALLPEPKTQWEAATWILAAVGDVCFQSGDFQAGRDSLSKAMQCPDAIGNPFIHLRLGQCQLELNSLDRAADELMRAYMGGGPDIFAKDNPKYLAFLKTRAKNIEQPKKSWQFWR